MTTFDFGFGQGCSVTLTSGAYIIANAYNFSPGKVSKIRLYDNAGGCEKIKFCIFNAVTREILWVSPEISKVNDVFEYSGPSVAVSVDFRIGAAISQAADSKGYLHGTTQGIKSGCVFYQGVAYGDIAVGKVLTVGVDHSKETYHLALLVETTAQKYLFKDGNDIKKFVPSTGWQMMGQAPVTEAMFATDGMDDAALAKVDNAAINLLTSQQPELLVWTEDFNATPQMKLTAVPQDQFVYATGDIDVGVTGNIDWIHVNDGTTGNETGGGKLCFVASRDQGATWWAYKNSAWVQVTGDAAAVMANGMTRAEFDAAPWDVWLRQAGYTKVRLGYGISMNTSADTAFNDNVKYQYSGSLKWKVAVNGVDYEAEYVSNTQLNVKFLTGGYNAKINY